MQFLFIIQIYNKNNNIWRNMYHTPYQPLTNIWYMRLGLIWGLIQILPCIILYLSYFGTSVLWRHVYLLTCHEVHQWGQSLDDIPWSPERVEGKDMTQHHNHKRYDGECWARPYVIWSGEVRTFTATVSCSFKSVLSQNLAIKQHQKEILSVTTVRFAIILYLFRKHDLP